MIEKNRGVVVAGGSGFLGKHVLNELISRGYEHVVNFSRRKVTIEGVENMPFDASKIEDVHHVLMEGDVVINLAAAVGGIGANQKNPGLFMYQSLIMGMNLIEVARSVGCHKFVQIGTVCSYPKFCPVPFKESDLWNGYPEETNAPYGIAKKTLMELVKAYNIQYPDKFRGVNIVPVNMYGPGDNFDLESSHVIPALIRKFHNAKVNGDESVTLWGTGVASREFLYVKDAAKGIVDAMEKLETDEPVNLGTGKEITIGLLAAKIAFHMQYAGDILFDASKPDGQPRRCLDTSAAKELFGFEATTHFGEGLKETINWFKEHLA